MFPGRRLSGATPLKYDNGNNRSTGKTVGELDIDGEVFEGALWWSPDGRRLGLAGPHRVIRWDLESGKGQRLFGYTESNVVFHPSGEFLVFAEEDGSIVFKKIGVRKAHLKLHGGHHNVGPMAFTQDGSTMVTGGGDTTVLIWELEL